jgi:hypothetical protein
MRIPVQDEAAGAVDHVKLDLRFPIVEERLIRASVV